MPKIVLMAIASGITSLALLGAAQATNKPIQTTLEVAQAQVPQKCASIKDPAERKKCLESQKER
ncbi:MAG TPA: hypothetical protein VLN73_01085 [Alphaproteobacteria bacterium]|nr:hypothetical protein [Alphaproteobacteria bacterium]